jgi:hypothetical protein
MADPKKKPNKRRGRVKRTAENEPAEFEEGSAVGSKAFDPAEVCEELNLYWEVDSGNEFVVCVGDSQWCQWPEGKVKKEARDLPGRLIALKAREGERLSEMDRVLLHAMKYRQVEKLLPALAGYRAGLHELPDGRKIIVRMPPRLLEPKQGEWPTIRALIEGRLDEEGVPGFPGKQSTFFYGWCKVAVDNLYYGEPGSYKPGHLLALAGPVGCGKSLIQKKIITAILGGRHADPTAFLAGEDSFNADMMGAEHLQMEELLTGSQKTMDRVALSEAMKRLVATDSKRMRLMRTDPLTVDPFWRFSLSLNDDPDKLRAFPMLTGDFRDKVIMLRVLQRPLPMPTGTGAEIRAFNEKLKAEMPAFVWWLMNEFTVPAELLVTEGGADATRFGFRSWQHPSLATELWDDTPAAQLLRLIDAAEFEHKINGTRKLWELTDEKLNQSGRHGRDGTWTHEPGLWRGGAIDLERLLVGDVEAWPCSVAKEAQKLFRHAAVERLLSRLKEDVDTRVAQHRTNKARLWAICAP